MNLSRKKKVFFGFFRKIVSAVERRCGEILQKLGKFWKKQHLVMFWITMSRTWMLSGLLILIFNTLHLSLNFELYCFLFCLLQWGGDIHSCGLRKLKRLVCWKVSNGFFRLCLDPGFLQAMFLHSLRITSLLFLFHPLSSTNPWAKHSLKNKTHLLVEGCQLEVHVHDISTQYMTKFTIYCRFQEFDSRNECDVSVMLPD